MLFLWTAILPLTVLLYYFFRKKYKEQPVSSTIFWNEAMQETRVSPYLKHLQKNVLLYLQLLALLLFMFALMNPFVRTTEMTGEQIVWIVDTSATMLAGKETSTFEQHKEKMKSLVTDLQERPLTIITTGEEPEIIARQETDTNAIHRAIDQLEVTYEEEQLAKAIKMAQAFIGETSTSIYLFTDAIERSELPIESEYVKWIVNGASEGLENVAIERFAATATEDHVIALVQLKNETSAQKLVQLHIKNEVGELLFEQSLELSPNEHVTKTIEELEIAHSLTATIEVEDDYPIDNSFITLLGQNNNEIVVDQQMHQLVRKGLQVLNTDVKIAAAEQLESVNQEAIVVTNQTEILKKGNSPVLLIGRDDESSEEVSGLVEVSDDGLFAFSSLEDVYVNYVYPAFENYETIAIIGERPFIQRSPRGDIVILTDIEATDWPLHPSFPLFLWSVQNELIEGAETLGIFSPNESRAVPLTGGDWSIYTAENQYITSFENPGHFKAPIEPGLYTVRSSEGEKQFIVQLAGQERTIKEGTSFELGMRQASNQEGDVNKSLLMWLLIPILFFLVIEWEVQRRRGFTN